MKLQKSQEFVKEGHDEIEQLKGQLAALEASRGRPTSPIIIRGEEKAREGQQKELEKSRKQAADWQMKYLQTSDRLNIAERALAKELGPGKSVENVYGKTWKGRAQEILSLRGKVDKKLKILVGILNSPIGEILRRMHSQQGRTYRSETEDRSDRK